MCTAAETNMRPGYRMDGFVVVSVTPLETLRSTARELCHEQSGARILHVYNDDPENLFSVSFATPPPDDTGAPHILEHSVLAGSRKYPVREPFFEMVKMSMATFINAMTGPDCTYYPVASNVKQDLFNLAEVYFDAVFHPLLTEHTFKREAHHLAPLDAARPGGDLTINGIVYNEMKGAFSDPETRLWRIHARGLFPDTIYGRESGGDPEAIPELTYEALTAFHRAYYRPGNARFFFYGNIPTHEYLAFLKDRLADFREEQVSVDIPRQQRWREPRIFRDTYPVGSDDRLSENTYLVMSWLAGDAADAADTVVLHLLSLILLGNEAAPLKKALVDSGLGADLVSSGDGAIGCEGTFSVGLKGSDPDRVDAFTSLVLDTLSRLAAAGIGTERVEAAFQQAAYQYLEIRDMFPLQVMDRVIHAWIYGRNPLAFVSLGENLRSCREAYRKDPALFERLIRERLVDNPHRLTVVLAPDRNMETRQRTEFTAAMKKKRAALSEEEAGRIALDAAELDRLNSEPNPPELVARLPQLAIGDVPLRLNHVPTSVENVAGTKLLANDVFSNGINYLLLDFDLRGLPPELWCYLPRYEEAIGKLGAAGVDYEKMAARKAAATGGIGCRPVLATHAADPCRAVWSLRFSMKALDEQIDPALEVLHDLLFGVDPRDRKRLRDVLLQTLASLRTDLLHNGSGTAACHAGRGITPEGYLAETLHGLPQLHLAEELNRDFDGSYENVAGRIEAIRGFLLDRGRLTASFTGSDEALERVRTTLKRWVAGMPDAAPAPGPSGFEPFAEPMREGLAGPIQVAHCAMVMPAPHFSHPDETLLTVGAHLLKMDYMLQEIRLKGNAYGAWFNYEPFGGTMQMGSYNDPHIARTIGVFEDVTDFVAGSEWTRADVDRAVIATAKREQRPVRPATATNDALQRHLSGVTPGLREERYARLMTAAPAEVRRALLKALRAGMPRAAVCVVSNRNKLEEANAHMRDRPLAIQDILIA